MIGAYGSTQNISALNKPFDTQILDAFDQKYVNRVLNATGFGTNYVSTRDLSEESIMKKPY
jgi:hypothetical protein